MKNFLRIFGLVCIGLANSAMASSTEYICRLAHAENNDFDLKILNLSLTDTPAGPELVKNSVFANVFPMNSWVAMIKLVENNTKTIAADGGTEIIGEDNAQQATVLISISTPRPSDGAFFRGEVDIYTKANGDRPMEAHLYCMKGQSN